MQTVQTPYRRQSSRLLPEEELQYMYLNLDTSGGAYEFDEAALENGYVDIRQ